MTLVHDLVEVYAGTHLCYDEKGNEDKPKENAMPQTACLGYCPSPKVRGSGRCGKFDAEDTPPLCTRARLTACNPLLSNYRPRGHTWKDGPVTSTMVLRRMDPIRRALPAVWPEVERMVTDALRQGWLPR
jgi:putative hydrolase of HD superfamily